MQFDFIQFVRDQKAFSRKTFGPGTRLLGVTEHIRRELKEVRDSGGKDASEWADIIILAIDGAWRSGIRPTQLARALTAKLAKNKARKWPDWRKAGPGPIEHIRE